MIIGALVAAIALCYLVEMFIAPVDWAAAGLAASSRNCRTPAP